MSRDAEISQYKCRAQREHNVFGLVFLAKLFYLPTEDMVLDLTTNPVCVFCESVCRECEELPVEKKKAAPSRKQISNPTLLSSSDFPPPEPPNIGGSRKRSKKNSAGPQPAAVVDTCTR
jgi:hypothetical protein